jgi:5-methylcytosine-specific restriction endonuclease McrA
MECEAREIINIIENLLEKDDAMTAWYLQDAFKRIWNKQEPNSPEREALAAVWKKMMIMWH